MDHTVRSDARSCIYFDTSVKNCMIANYTSIADKGVRVYFHMITQHNVLTDVGESAAINVLANLALFTEKARLFDSCLLKTNETVIFFEQPGEAGIRII